ncbi:multidrug effflux MFS transporter [Pseudomonas sp. Q1-7]|uniref:multidrug effflux MFS transporter n=1 Tax=Pseudomonas sp. Q1-7 TaxID=3020843 RepID=UPI00230196F5|nr:multidrug effflux MFS transporter [Pseudomonas sp. Q1-7]
MNPSRLLLAILMVLTALGEISTQLIIPALGGIEQGLGAGHGASLAALSGFVAAFGIGQLLLGPLSDRVGRRPVLIGGLSLYLAATAWMLLADSMTGFILGRVVQGLGACAALVLARAIVRDVWKAQAAPALAMTVIGMLSAIALAPMAGGLLTQWGGWHAPIVASLSIGSLALLAVLAFYRESNPSLDPQAGHPATLARDYFDLLRQKSSRALAFTLAGTYGAMFAVVAGSSSVYIGLLGLSAAEYGLAFGATISGLIAGALFTQRKIMQLGPQRIVGIGVSLVITGALATLVVYATLGLSVVGLSLPQVLVTLGGGMLIPASVAGVVMPNAHRAGLAAGLMGFAQMLGATLSGLILGALQDGSATPMIGVQAVFAVTAFSGFMLMTRKPRAAAVSTPG